MSISKTKLEFKSLKYMRLWKHKHSLYIHKIVNTFAYTEIMYQRLCCLDSVS